MSIDTYSFFIALGTLAIFAAVIIGLISYAASPDFRTRMQGISEVVWLKIIGVIAITSTLAALAYQFVYATPVCEMCWWQRIFIFPIDIVVLWSLIQKQYVMEKIIATLSGIGWLFAAYHYWLHFNIFVLSNEVTSNCNIYGTLPSCTESPVVVFGFVTIPFMSLTILTAIFLISVLLIIKKRQK